MTGITVRRSLLVALLVATLAGGTACTDSTAGNPTTGGTTTTAAAPTGTGTKSPTKTTKPGGEESKLTSVQPCDLISSTNAKTLGITGSPEEVKVGKARVCEWRVDKGSVAENYVLAVAIFDTLGLKDLVGTGGIKPMQVGKREAAQSMGAGGSVCAITLAVTEKSRVDVQASGGTSEKLCAPALEAAKLVEPELP